MANVQIKSEKITPFGGIFSIMDSFDAFLSNVIDSTLGLRSRTIGYQYSEILSYVVTANCLKSLYGIRRGGA